MLEHLFTSKARVKLLTLFLSNPGKEFFVRELTRVLGEQINSIRRELENLHALGFVKFKIRNRKKYFSVNPHFALYPELKAIIDKTTLSFGEMAVELARLGELDALLVSGKLLRVSQAPIDLLIIGQLDKRGLEHFIHGLEKRLGTELRYSVMTSEDYLFRKSCQDKFIRSVLSAPHQLIPHQSTPELISSL